MKTLITLAAASLALIAGLAQAADAPASAPKTAQQSKMAACNQDAADKSLKGAERKKFMSECLKG